jgi:hypothetical protein
MGKHKEPSDSTLSLENFARDCPGIQHLSMSTEAICGGVQVGRVARVLIACNPVVGNGHRQLDRYKKNPMCEQPTGRNPMNQWEICRSSQQYRWGLPGTCGDPSAHHHARLPPNHFIQARADNTMPADQNLPSIPTRTHPSFTASMRCSYEAPRWGLPAWEGSKITRQGENRNPRERNGNEKWGRRRREITVCSSPCADALGCVIPRAGFAGDGGGEIACKIVGRRSEREEP